MKITDIALKTVCQPATFDRPKQNLKLAHELIRFMHREKGMGLAANQVGINLRLFVMLIDDRYYHCFNPEILDRSHKKIVMQEGCLSFPNQWCEVDRPERILVQYYSAQGKQTTEWLDGWAARCYQHELDHLDGITMWEHARVVK